MGATNFPDGVNIGSEAGGTAIFQLGGTTVTLTAAEMNVLGAGLSAAELDFLDGAVAGTVVASKAVVVDGSKKIDTIDITTPLIGGSTVTASAAELNYIDTSVPGTAIASKALVLGTGKNVDTLDIDAGGFKIATVAVTPTAAELNTLAGALGAKALTYDNASARVAASGSTAITGAGTVASGMANVQHVVASLANVGTAAGEANTVFADPVTVGGGSILFKTYDRGGTVATSAGTVNWLAIGTAA